MRVFHRNAFFLLLWISCLASTVSAQSTNQSFPTPVTSNEISGTIKARDVGDSRLTTYFYQFDGDQGDVFINVVASNFTGDIDVFTLNGLRPLTKIVLYADTGSSETGRVIYLRKPEKMILRVQGRTPGDDVATFRVKFAGSFVASTMAEPGAEPTLPSVTAKNESGIRVNSVGTIVEVIPKATPTPTPVDVTSGVVDERSGVEETEKAVAEPKVEDKPVEIVTEAPEKKLEVVVTENIPPATETKTATPPARRRTRGRATARRSPPATTSETERTSGPATLIPPRSTRRGRVPPKTTTPAEPDPLEKVNLVIEFKDGTVIERPMSEVFRFTVDKGILTVISKDGSIGRYSILDVAKLTIQ
jgi:hypothetical protein